VERARHDLIMMIRLQRIYSRIAEAIQERNTAPPEVVELQEENRLRQAELDTLEQEVGQHTEELREVRKKENEYSTELEHFQRQKARVTNEREFTAVISEIDYATKGLEESTNRRQELEAAIGGLEEDIASRRQARPDEEDAHRRVSTSWEARKTELLEQVHGLSGEAKEIEGQLQPNHRARFMRLLESKRGTALAAVLDGSCSLCHFSLRPHLQQRVRRGQEIIDCEHCHRILYMPELEEEAGP
jgi:predicted  nucleic acid-binding Zn-ribbon protein